MPSDLKYILIADDDEDDVEMFIAAIDEACHAINVTVVTNGVKLLALLSKIPKPDAILLDLNMPLKSGRECLDEIRSKQEFDKVPIAILSTSGSKGEIDYCLTNGANLYFVKPNSFDGMKSIVQNIVAMAQ